MMNFFNLPIEIICLITEILDFDSFTNLSRSCRQIRDVILNDTVCRSALKVAAFSAETIEAQGSGDYARAFRIIAKRRASIRYAEPFLVAVVALIENFIYTDGILCYTCSPNNLQILNVHRSAKEELIVNIPRLLEHAIKDYNPRGKYSFRPVHCSHGILSCLYVPDASGGDSDDKLIVLRFGAMNVEFIASHPITTTRKLFVRNDEDYLIFGTKSRVDFEGFYHWVLYRLDIQTGVVMDQELVIWDFNGSCLGRDICFEIFNGYFYCLSIKDKRRPEYGKWNSFYYALRFPLSVATKESCELPPKKNLWRRNSAREGQVDERWNTLQLTRDEGSGKLFIFESRREWLLQNPQSQRNCYRKELSFDIGGEGYGQPESPIIRPNALMEEISSEEGSDEEVPDEEVPDEEVFDEEAQHEEMFDEEVSDEEAQHEEVSDEEVFDEEVFNEEVSDEEVFDEEVFDEEVSDEEVFDEEVFDEEVSDEEVSDEEAQHEEVSDEEVFDEEVFNEEVSDEEVFDEEVFDEEVSDEEVFDEEVFDEEVSDEEVSDEEVLDAEVVEEVQHYETRPPECVHTGDSGMDGTMLLLRECFARFYNPSAETFFDLQYRSKCIRLRMQPRPRYDGRSTESLGVADAQLPDSKFDTMGTQGVGTRHGINVWPPDRVLRNHPVTVQLENILWPQTGFEKAEWTMDERSLVYAPGGPVSGCQRPLVLISFDPSIHLPGYPKLSFQDANSDAPNDHPLCGGSRPAIPVIRDPGSSLTVDPSGNQPTDMAPIPSSVGWAERREALYLRMPKTDASPLGFDLSL